MIAIPPGTVIFEPDGIHQVTLQFKTEDDAIIFYESLVAITQSAGYKQIIVREQEDGTFKVMGPFDPPKKQ